MLIVCHYSSHDLFVYPRSASAVQEVALKETQELLKQEREEVATLKVCLLYNMYTNFITCTRICSQHQAQLDLVDQNKDSVNSEEIMKEK